MGRAAYFTFDMTPAPTSVVLSARAFERTITRMADEIIERNDGTDRLLLVGIQRRGVQIAARIAALITRPVVGKTHLPVAIEGLNVVIVDDVLFTGRTIRAALDELADFGRPARVSLAVLVDRGGRELPIQPDVVGKHVEVPIGSRVDVCVAELDGKDEVLLVATEAL